MSKTNYIHLRLSSDNWAESSPFGGITVGYRINDDLNSITYTVSRVHPTDRYIKSVGRTQVDKQLDECINCRILGREQVLAASGVAGQLNKSVVAKLTIADFNWPAVTQAVRSAVEKDLGRHYSNDRYY